MPTYQYACTSDDCGLRFERVQAFTDPAISECPECSQRVRKVYGSVGVVFKGSGFYRTDSRDAKSGSGAAKSGEAAKFSEASSSSGSSSDSGKADSSGSGSGGSSKGSGDSGPAAKAPAATTAS